MGDDNQNEERTVRCPVEGCNAEKLARGMHLHVRQSSGDGHGPHGDVPDHIDFENLETVGEQKVEMDYPEERETEHVARLCPYCSNPFKGKNGVLIHLGQVAGRKNHPEDASERHTEEDFPRVEIDEQGNITSVADDPVDPGHTDLDKGAVSVQQVYHLVADLIADGEIRTAHKVRRQLLGTDDAVAPDREEPPHPKLFEALLAQGRAEQTEHRVTSALEGEGIMVACRGQSAFYTASEARDVAARLEQVATSEGWRDNETKDLIKFLRYGADVLDGNRTEQSLHEEFDQWQ